MTAPHATIADRRVVASIEVAAPPAEVFALLADPRRHTDFDGSGSVQGVVSGPDRLAPGARFGMTMKIGAPYRVTNSVVEFEEGRRIAWRHFGGHRWRYELAPVDATHTKVTESFDYSMYGVGPRLLIEALRFPTRNRDGIHQTLQRLRGAAEADSSAAGASGDLAAGAVS